MLATLRTAAVFGVEAVMVQVEVDVSNGMPAFAVVGLPDRSVRESRDRVRTAIRNSGYEYPPDRVTVNLGPADLHKAGSWFDLPIALGVLAATGKVATREIGDVLLLGELSLDGGIRPTRGVLPAAVAAARHGVRRVLLAPGNAMEAAVVSGVQVVPVSSLREAVDIIEHPDSATPLTPDAHVQAQTLHGAGLHGLDLADVRGQPLARRALEIAAAGRHHLLFSGPPGCGKTMLARRLPGILPPLSFDEAIEVTAIHSVSGQLEPGGGLITDRPFRAPHHTVSNIALVGGGQTPRPGEISLAHNGVLFLDEFPEFSRRALEVLRQPLEEGYVWIARAARTARFPARFMLIAAMNPCPCGYQGDPKRECRCTPTQVLYYTQRISGPLRDRLDLVVNLPPLTISVLSSDAPAESSAVVRARVEAARAKQLTRFRTAGATELTTTSGTPSHTLPFNAMLSGRALRQLAAPTRECLELLEEAAERYTLSARAHDRVLRVARTIADLDASDAMTADHIAEALMFR
jgi:magnesium chelatase family protein